MSNVKRIAIIIIIVGAFILTVLYPFTSLTSSANILRFALGTKGVIYKPRLNDIEKGIWIKDDDYNGHFEGHIAVPYHYVLAFGITLAFLGVGLLSLSRSKNKND